LDTSHSLQRYFIEIAYKGSKFHGWQIQENAHSVQAELNRALSVISSESIETTGAGRTDTGVHALQLFAHFDSRCPPEKWNDAVFHLNCMIDEDIVVKRIFKVPDDAHARFDALSRSYEYHVYTGKNPFLREFAYDFKGRPDIKRMNEAAAILFEYTDFSCFSKTRTQVTSNICTILHSEWKEHDEKLIYYISANRFLRNMVRAITGTLLNVGMGKTDLNEFRRIIENKKRSDAGLSVPACGLYLTNISYPDNMISSNIP
jgi:tRNA pseudouridine38-40 synthase